MSRPAAALKASPFQWLVAVASIPMATLVALWVVAGRMLFGVSGPMVAILGYSLGPALFILLLIAGVKTTANAFRSRPAGAPAKTCALLLAAWLAATGFGFTVPDFGGNGGSAMSALAGEAALGMSTALCNPLGIISVGLAITVAVTSWRDAKYGRH